MAYIQNWKDGFIVTLPNYHSSAYIIKHVDKHNNSMYLSLDQRLLSPCGWRCRNFAVGPNAVPNKTTICGNILLK